MKQNERPNILLIQADQLTSFALGCYGHPVAITPNIDSLADGGVLFRNAYCNSPLCGPSRNSMMTGRHPHVIGSYDNANELPASFPTFAHVLTNAGYACWLSGKMHFVGPDQLHGFHGRTNTDIYPSGYAWTPDWTRGAYPNHGTSVRYLHQSGPCQWNLQLDYDEETATRGLRCLRDLVRGQTEDRDPFFLCVSFTQPHDPFVAERGYWDRYRDLDIPEPAAPAVPIESMHPFDRWIQIHHEVDAYPPSAETVCAARRAYLAMTSYIDDRVGEFVRELDRLGVSDRTVVLLTSDHGDMQGEHGMWYKRTFREWAMRVPLIVNDPRVPSAGGRRIDSPVSLVDLFPTLCDLAGASADWPGAKSLDGTSLAPWLSPGGATGSTSTDDRTVFAEYCGEGTVQPMRMIRRGNWKYVDVHSEAPLLFDLEDDPGEMHSLAGKTDVEAIERQLASRVLDGWDAADLRNRIIHDQHQRLFLDAALKRGAGDIWDHQPVEDARHLYVRRGKSTQETKQENRWPFVPAEEES